MSEDENKKHGGAANLLFPLLKEGVVINQAVVAAIIVRSGSTRIKVSEVRSSSTVHACLIKDFSIKLTGSIFEFFHYQITGKLNVRI